MKENEVSSNWDEMKPKKSKTFDLIEDRESKSSLIKPTRSFRVEEEDHDKRPRSKKVEQERESRSPRMTRSPREHFEMRHLRTLESINENVKTVTFERKWLCSFIIAVAALLLFSTFTVGIADQYFFKKGIDLFDKTNRKNELILNAIQFVLLFFIVRVIFNYL